MPGRWGSLQHKGFKHGALFRQGQQHSGSWGNRGSRVCCWRLARGGWSAGKQWECSSRRGRMTKLAGLQIKRGWRSLLELTQDNSHTPNAASPQSPRRNTAKPRNTATSHLEIQATCCWQVLSDPGTIPNQRDRLKPTRHRRERGSAFHRPESEPASASASPAPHLAAAARGAPTLRLTDQHHAESPTTSRAHPSVLGTHCSTAA